MTTLNNATLSYDVENRLTGYTTGTFAENYAYDEGNRRVERWNSSGSDDIYVYGPSGKLLTVVQVNTLGSSPWMTLSTLSNRVYLGGMLLGTTTGYAISDADLIKDRLGSVQPSYAYGTDTGSGQQTSPGDDFATYWKDSSTGFEYAMNRYYSAGYGRFLTVDPFGGSARVGNPGSMNRYSYALGDPLNLYDPTGLSPEVVGSGCDPDDEDGWVCYTIYDDDGSGGPGEGRGGRGGGGGFIWVLPKVPGGNNYAAAQMQALTDGLNNALIHTDSDKCAQLYAGGDEDPSQTVASVLENTLYRLLQLPAAVGAQTVDQTDVQINTAGAFFNVGPNANGTLTVWMPNPAGVPTQFTFDNTATFQGFILLHELGHQMGVFGQDTDGATNGANSQAVLDNCFSEDAQGVLH